jgi:hypothetical protein
LIRFRPLLTGTLFLEAAGAVGKNDLGLKSKHHLQIKLAQIGETHYNKYVQRDTYHGVFEALIQKKKISQFVVSHFVPSLLFYFSGVCDIKIFRR